MNELNASALHIATYSGWYRFEESDGQWTQVDRALTFWKMTALQVDPNDPRHLYLATEHSGLFVSENGGAGSPTFNSTAEGAEERTSDSAGGAAVLLHETVNNHITAVQMGAANLRRRRITRQNTTCGPSGRRPRAAIAGGERRLSGYHEHDIPGHPNPSSGLRTPRPPRLSTWV